jgi:hypothetical protein
VRLVTGNMIGSGIFFLPRDRSPFGRLAIVAWVITGASGIPLLIGMKWRRLAVPDGCGQPPSRITK